MIVGHKALARFKISNTNKVPCDVVFTLKPIASRSASKQQQDIFEVDPPRVQIPNHSYAYVTASFTPPSMQVCFVMFSSDYVQFLMFTEVSQPVDKDKVLCLSFSHLNVSSLNTTGSEIVSGLHVRKLLVFCGIPVVLDVFTHRIFPHLLSPIGDYIVVIVRNNPLKQTDSTPIH